MIPSTRDALYMAVTRVLRACGASDVLHVKVACGPWPEGLWRAQIWRPSLPSHLPYGDTEGHGRDEAEACANAWRGFVRRVDVALDEALDRVADAQAAQYRAEAAAEVAREVEGG